MKFSLGRYVPLVIAIGVFILDFSSKYLTHHYVPLMRANWSWYPYGGIGIFKDFLGIEFSISHHINRGAAWGVLSDFQVPLVYARIILIALLLIYALWWNTHKAWRIPLAFIIAGALGNVVDYFLYGHVVDMFHFVLWEYDFPVFNIADSSIFIGVALLLILSFIEKEPGKIKKK